MIAENRDTILSLISSAAGGSISLIRLSGQDSFELMSRYFKSKSGKEAEGGRFFFGKIIDNKGEVIDEVVVLFYRKPHSYTGEDVVEISCHANPFIIKDLLTLFQSAGCRLAEPGEFTRRAFLNAKMDLVQAEAVADLIMSKSRAAVKNSLMHVEGKLSEQLKTIKTQLRDTASMLELDLDFSEEDIDVIASDDIDKKLKNIIDTIDKFISSYHYGHVLSKGIEVLIAGKPNVGKSSLMNAFLMKDRVIVSDIPGTTRDMIHEDMVIENTLIRFIDSAGIHLTEDVIEMQGVSRAKRHMDHADIILIMIDISEPLTDDDMELLDRIHTLYPEKMIVCGNKKDLGVHGDNLSLLDKKTEAVHLISAIHNTGIDHIKKIIIEKVHDMEHHVSDELMISNERQYNALKKCLEALEAARETLHNNVGFEFVAVDLHTAITHISEVTGEITADDILNNIFSQFCIGK